MTVLQLLFFSVIIIVYEVIFNNNYGIFGPPIDVGSQSNNTENNNVKSVSSFQEY